MLSQMRLDEECQEEANLRLFHIAINGIFTAAVPDHADAKNPRLKIRIIL